MRHHSMRSCRDHLPDFDIENPIIIFNLITEAREARSLELSALVARHETQVGRGSQSLVSVQPAYGNNP